MVVFSAFVTACFTDFCTYGRKFGTERRIPRQCMFQIGTDIRTFTVEAYALRHHFHILFLQAGIIAVVACLRTLMQRLDQISILFMGHSEYLQYIINSYIHMIPGMLIYKQEGEGLP